MFFGVASPGFLLVSNNFLFVFPGLIGACSGVSAVVKIAEVVTVESSEEVTGIVDFLGTVALVAALLI